MEFMKKSETKPPHIQVPFRCDPELHARIIRAMGNVMGQTGEKVSKNEFLIQLIESGLDAIKDGSRRINRKV